MSGAACGAWIIFNEMLGPWQIFGGGVVLVGIFLCHDAAARRSADTLGKTFQMPE